MTKRRKKSLQTSLSRKKHDSKKALYYTYSAVSKATPSSHDSQLQKSTQRSAQQTWSFPTNKNNWNFSCKISDVYCFIPHYKNVLVRLAVKAVLKNS